MFVLLGTAARKVLVGLPGRQCSQRQRRKPRLLIRVPATAVTMDRAAAHVGGPADLGDQRTFGAKPAHDDHDLRT